MQENPLELMRTIDKTKDMELFDNETIRFIINYKWETYTKFFFKIQFHLFLPFTLGVLVNIYFIIYDTEKDISFILLLKIPCMCILGYFSYYEV
jgi:hypothetical protein